MIEALSSTATIPMADFEIQTAMTTMCIGRVDEWF